jgi:hypothetical protein
VAPLQLREEALGVSSEANKRAKRISMELRLLTTEQQKELRRKNFSRIEKRRITEENKRRLSYFLSVLIFSGRL